MNKKVLTIIVSYNFEPWIHKCIPSLLHSSYPTDIFVIDNASKDNTVEILKAQYPSIILVEALENLGFGKANNVGMKYAVEKGYDYVFLVNQDAWVDKDCIKQLLDANAPPLAMRSPVHYDGTEKALDKGFAHYCKTISLDKDIQKVEFVNAAFWFIPTDILMHVGIFSPIFYHYGEDKDYVNRLKYHHIPLFVVNRAKAYHDRQGREENTSINFKSEFVYHLTEFCNINYPWSNAFAKAILAAYKKAVQQLIKGNFVAFKKYLTVTSQLWNKSSEVKETRRKNKIITSSLKS